MSELIAAIVPEVIQMILVQEENARIMVVARLDETGDPTTDRVAAENLCTHLGSQNPKVKIVDSFRIGPTVANRPRLLKIAFQNSSMRNSKLKNGKMLKGYLNGKVFIRPSMTRSQREEQHQMIQKVKEERIKNPNLKIQVRADFHGKPYYFDYEKRAKTTF